MPTSRTFRGLVPLLAVLCAPGASLAQDVAISGQLRPRYEFRDPTAAGRDDFSSMRVRIGVHVPADDGLEIFVQAQDVRVWGEESHPLFDYRADALDLHQAYLRYTAAALPWLTTTLGRMEASLGEERLMGTVDWTQQGQAFDGVRLDATRTGAQVALLGYQVGDDTAPAVLDDELFGVYGTLSSLGPGDLDVYWFLQRVHDAAATSEHTVGARYAFGLAGFDGRAEGSLQTGTRSDADVSAFMLGARLGRRVAGGSVTLWYDYLSGDDPTTPEVEVFNTLYATNHKFYGLADLFTNVPAHTGGAGLQDAAVKVSWPATERVSLAADGHRFYAARQGALSSGHFGDEADVSGTWRHSERLATAVGVSYVLQDDPWSEIGRLAKDMTWFYVMVNATF